MNELKRDLINHEVRGAAGGEAAQIVAQQTSRVLDQTRALTQNLMEKVCEQRNLDQAVKRVRANKGSPGIDKMRVDELEKWMKEQGEELRKMLLEDRYRPQPVRSVEIPKAQGGIRELGIPTVVDRVIQQALLQVLSPIFDPSFSESSYGFRPKRSAHDALKAAQEYVRDGYNTVVDIDLEKFFDRVNHDILMSRLHKRIEDKRALHLIRKYLQAGMFKNGLEMDREEGTPQGGPLSPLLGNFLLDELDKELESRGHKFCRYADDCNIYVRSEAAGNRVMASVTKFLDKRLRLKVNRTKSAVAPVEERQFLGHRLLKGGRLAIAPKAVKKMKDRIREITGRHRGVKFSQVINDLNKFIIGWVTYFRNAMIRQLLKDLDRWIRRRLRCYLIVQRKHVRAIARYLIRLGMKPSESWSTARYGRNWWRTSSKKVVKIALSNSWFSSQGLITLSKRFDALKVG